MMTETDHPTAEELVAYALGELAAEEESRLRRHVEGCEECRDLAQDLAAFPDLEPPDDSYRVGEEELRETRGKLRARLLEPSEKEAEAEPKVLRFSAPQPSRSTKPPMAVWWAVAAALLLVFGWGLSGHRTAGRLKEQVSDLEGRLKAAESWVNVRSATLLPAEDPLRSSEEPELTLEDGLLLILEAEEVPPSPLTAEVRTTEGNTVWRVEGLKARNGVLTFALRPGELDPGEYRIFLVDHKGEELPVSFVLRLAE